MRRNEEKSKEVSVDDLINHFPSIWQMQGKGSHIFGLFPINSRHKSSGLKCLAIFYVKQTQNTAQRCGLTRPDFPLQYALMLSIVKR